MEKHPTKPDYYRRKSNNVFQMVDELRTMNDLYFPAFELYDLSTDPGETNNIARDNPAIVKEMKDELKNTFGDSYKIYSPSDFDPEVQEKLRALGYLQ